MANKINISDDANRKNLNIILRKIFQSARWEGLKPRFLHSPKFLIEPVGKSRTEDTEFLAG